MWGKRALYWLLWSIWDKVHQQDGNSPYSLWVNLIWHQLFNVSQNVFHLPYLSSLPPSSSLSCCSLSLSSMLPVWYRLATLKIAIILGWEKNTDIISIIFDDVGQTLCQRAPWQQSWQMVALLPYPQSRRCHHYVFVWIHTLFAFLYFLVFYAFLVFSCTLPKVKEVSPLCICLVVYLLYFLVFYVFSCTITTVKKLLPFCIYLGIIFSIVAGDY